MAKVRVKRGSEGPAHDPYGYTEVTFTRTDGRVIVGHFGLAEWVKVDGHIYADGQGSDFWFHYWTRMRFEKAARIPEILEARQMRGWTRAERESYWLCREADQRLLRYAM